MEFQVCFTFANHENDMLLYVRQPMCLLMLFCNSKTHFHQLEPFQLIKTMLESLNVLYGLSPVWNHYPKGSHNTWGT